MASSDNRTAFRLPWQSGHGSDAEAEAGTGTAVVDPPAWPSSDLARRQSRTATPVVEPGTDAPAETTTETVTAPGDEPAATADDAAVVTAVIATAEVAPAVEVEPAAEVAPADEVAERAAKTARTATAVSAAAAPTAEADGTAVQQRDPMTETMTRPARETAPDLASRKPTKFLLDLTRAMRQAADEARQSALAQFRGDVERHTTDAREACEAAAAEARRRADEDITALAEWETAEIARIRRETEEGITARHVRLEQEIAEQAAHLDEEIGRVRTRVEAFEAQMDAFFENLLREDDPGRFAGLAEMLPEAPSFDAWTPDATTWTPEPVTAEMLAAAEAAATAGTTDTDTPADAEAVHDGTDAVSEAGMADPTDATGVEPAMAMLTAGDAATEPAAEDATDDGMPPMLPNDFAAAEAEAADWGTEDALPVDAEVTTEPVTAESATEAEAAEAAADAAPWPPAAVPAPVAVTTTKTQVAVVGLVSVASIATFKRLLARTPGVHGVQVASGPDGEFLFTATHDSTLDMPAAVAAVQGFEVEVMESGPGIVMARAVDPEVV